jgi:hypothetical protein
VASAIQNNLSAWTETPSLAGYGVVALTVLTFGCAGRSSTPTEPEPPQLARIEEPRPLKSIPSQSHHFSDRSTGERVMRSEELVFTTVDPEAWEGQPRRGEWSGLRHRDGASEYWARHVAARRTVTLEECEADSRTTLALLRVEANPASERSRSLGDTYQGRVRVLLHPGAGGRVEAFFVGTSRCLALVFATDGSPGFPERLQFVASEVMDSLRLMTLDERGLGRWL